MKNINKLLKKAERGDIEACLDLGVFYHTGEYKDMDKAVYWLQKAADGNNSKAQLLLGVIYYRSMGISINKTKGLELINLAVKNKNTNAIRTLAQIEHEAGNIDKALIFFNNAAKENDPKALYSLGKIYLNGMGVNKDDVLARSYIYKAAQLGFSPAVKKHKDLLGKLFLNFEFKDLNKRFMLMPDKYPHPCYIALLDAEKQSRNEHGEIESDIFIFGKKIIKKFKLKNIEIEELISCINNTDQYTQGGAIGMSFDVGFIFGMTENSVRVVVDCKHGWVVIKENFTYMGFGARMSLNKDKKFLLDISERLKDKYF